MDIITSRNNELVKEAVKLRDKKYREAQKCFFFEGHKLAHEALASKVEIKHIFLTQKAADAHPDLASHNNAILILDSVCEKLSENNAPDGVICVCRYIDTLHVPYTSAEDISTDSSCLILSGIRDPGNLGTIARTSAALGKKTLIISDDCADIYNSKTVRASMGAVFRINTFRCRDLQRSIVDLKNSGVEVFAAALDKKAISLKELPTQTCPRMFVLGNEGHGLDKSVIDVCSGTVIIPMDENAESLNVSSAATIFLWESCK